jgi:hypothetical protein
MNQWKFNRDYYEDIDLLPTDEAARLLPYAQDAARFERLMGVAAIVAGFIFVIGTFFDMRQMWVTALSACIGMLVIGMIGGEIKFRRFRCLTAAAIDKRRLEMASDGN